MPSFARTLSRLRRSKPYLQGGQSCVVSLFRSRPSHCSVPLAQPKPAASQVRSSAAWRAIWSATGASAPRRAAPWVITTPRRRTCRRTETGPKSSDVLCPVGTSSTIVAHDLAGQSMWGTRDPRGRALAPTIVVGDAQDATIGPGSASGVLPSVTLDRHLGAVQDRRGFGTVGQGLAAPESQCRQCCRSISEHELA